MTDFSDYEVNPAPVLIADLGFSVRTYNCLKREGVDTVVELAACTEEGLLDIRNFSQRSVDEVKDKLAEYKLQLSPSPHPYHGEDVVHEQVNIWRMLDVVVTIAPTGVVQLSSMTYTPGQFNALCELIDAIRRDAPEGPPNDG